MGINVDAVYAGDNMNAGWVLDQNPPIEREIASLEVKEFENDSGEKVKKVVVHFKGEEKCLSLNITNKNVLCDSFGNDTDDWIGKTVRIGIVKTTYKGKPCNGVLLDASKTSAAPPKSAPPVQCLGPAGEAKLAERMKPENLDLDDLRSHLAGVNDIPNPFLLSEAPAKWPVAWGPLIKAWIDDPAIRASSVPF